ncbi:hypothetical protein [Merdibacter massiliensis]|uniref:hypothetical protein n=1 Tax=Merdibacter massiliensis TaxID=1871030 RepID=UPI00096A983F|nr:hypothetical protein [Merdibacter massiliensis]
MTIYGQSAQTGQLIATGYSYTYFTGYGSAATCYSGIYVPQTTTLTINGGNIEAYGTSREPGNNDVAASPGIGDYDDSGYIKSSDVGTIVINRGNVLAKGTSAGGWWTTAHQAAGIGSRNGQNDTGSLIINGGSVTSTSGWGAFSVNSLEMNGGTVNTGEGLKGQAKGLTANNFALNGGTMVLDNVNVDEQFTADGTNGPVLNCTGLSGKYNEADLNLLVWIGSNGTVYGGYHLIEALTIAADEVLTINDNAELNVGDQTFTNNGTLRFNMGSSLSGASPSGKVEYQTLWDTDGDGKVDEITYTEKGTVPTHDDPVKEMTENTVYTFDTWTPDLSEIQSPTQYTAKFTESERKYTVTISSGEGYVVHYNGESSVAYNTPIEFTVEILPGFEFTWGDMVTVNDQPLSADGQGIYRYTVTSDTNIQVNNVSDWTNPDGDITFQGKSVKEDHHKLEDNKDINRFVNEDVEIAITGWDVGRDLKSIEYYRSTNVIDYYYVEHEIQDWVPYTGPITEKVKDGETFIYYVRLTDLSGNRTYFAAGATFDTTKPAIAGVKDGNTYYTTQNVMVTDENLEAVTLNNKKQDTNTFVLPGNVEDNYTIVATDKAGNKTEYTVAMKPISSLEAILKDLTLENVTSENTDELDAVQDIIDSMDLTNATEDERSAVQELESTCMSLISKIDEVAEKIRYLKEAVAGYSLDTVTSSDKDAVISLQKDIQGLISSGNLTNEEIKEMQLQYQQCENLLQKIEEIEQMPDDLEEALQNYDSSSVTSADKESIEQIKETIQDLINSGNLTEEEKTKMEELFESCDALLEKITEAKHTGNTENINRVENITAGNVKLEDKENLSAAKEDIENALKNFGNNYTEEEKEELQGKLEQINNALASIEKAESTQNVINALPETVEPDDIKAEALIHAAKEQYDQLTDHEKSLVFDKLQAKLKTLLEDLTDYKIIQGNGSKWTFGKDDTLTITANGAFSKFTGILIDGNYVAPSNYTAVSGSTIITVQSSYLKTLSAGNHTLTVLYTDGKTTGEFEIIKESPVTGINNDVMLWIVLLFMTGGVIGILMRNRKKKHM